MPQSWENFDRDQESAAMGAYVDKVAAALKARNEGRNLSCWPLCSFDGKHADLDPDGCCGIADITGWGETPDGLGEVFTVRVGGHKTVCAPDSDIPEVFDVAAEIVAGSLTLSVEDDGDGDGWTLSFQEDIEVSFAWGDDLTDDQNFDAAAGAIIEAAHDACEPFRRAMAEIDEAMDRLHADVDAGRYGPEPAEQPAEQS